MDLNPLHKRVIGLDVHQAKITACPIVEHDMAVWRALSANSAPSSATGVIGPNGHCRLRLRWW